MFRRFTSQNPKQRRISNPSENDINSIVEFIYEKYGAILFAISLHYALNTVEAEGFFHEFFERFYTKKTPQYWYQKFYASENAYNCLRASFRNHCIDKWRKKKRTITTIELDNEILDSETASPKILEFNKAAKIKEIGISIDSKYRNKDYIRVFYMLEKGMTDAEIKEATGIKSLHTIKNRLKTHVKNYLYKLHA